MRGNSGFPFTGFTPEERDQIKVVVSGVSCIMTRKGKLYPSVLKGLWDLKSNGRTIILVSDDSIGTADAYIRMLPVDAVVAEGGAVIVCHSKEGEITHVLNPTIRKDEVLKKRTLLLQRTSGLEYAYDQPTRAFNIVYEKKKMNAMEVRILKNTLIGFGAKFVEDQDRVYVWIGDYDRRQSVQHYMQGVLKMEESFIMEHTLFLASSPCDQQLYGYFQMSIGTKDIEDKKAYFQLLPSAMTEGKEGEGFLEITRSLLGV